MASKKLQNDLERFGIDMTSSQMHVFQAILIASEGPNKPANYGEISKSLESIAGKKYTKAYIYRDPKNIVPAHRPIKKSTLSHILKQAQMPVDKFIMLL